ncbi:TetR/AcrR family transcriptional regulator C-terminal domain-containing protein [Streptomyces sp. NPDC005955]|jgi:AcrR family transcriptional regulator|uniref:TetR/AcrR family transcriptional regulator n=1 Tax=Streptomyces sp. NPDC005955 TaxID=3364738 RepID=UPI0036A6BCC9
MGKTDDRGGRPARSSVWLLDDGRRQAPSRRGAHPSPSGLDRDVITRTTVRLLDQDGPAKFSMRRLAAELNVTAMSVYWYVDTKDDLLELAVDAAYGELRLPEVPEPGTVEEASVDWRALLRATAGEYRGLLVRHPWLSALAGHFLNIGPRSLEFSRTVHQVIRWTGVPAYGQTGAISAVFQFVYGFGTIEGHFRQRCAEAGVSQDEFHREAMRTIAGTPSAAPMLDDVSEMMAARAGDTVEEMREADFVFALELLIAGIEAMAARGRGGAGEDAAP